MPKEWSDQQKDAIYTRGRNILVSAAAGSGKTTVLAARVGDFVKGGGRIDTLLVVTFTKLAAAEMKQRIAKELRNLAAADPENAHLRKESLKIYKANISTIDSFGIDLLRRNFHVAGVAPDFSVLDENEVVMIKQGVVQGQMEEYFTSFPEGFADYLELFGENSDSDKAEELITKLAGFTETMPFPDRWLKRLETKACDADSAGKTVCALLLPVVEEYCRILEAAQGESYKGEGNDVVREDFLLMCDLRDSLKRGDWDGACRQAAGASFETLKSAEKTVNTLTLSEYRNKSPQAQSEKASYQTFLSSEIFTLTVTDLKADLAKMQEGLRFLFRAVSEFRGGVRREMTRRNGYSFAVISEMALDLVVSHYDFATGDFTLTDTAKRERARYQEVLIDEYQDVNDLQDLFFRAITENNCFAVGDVKQSIYGFRGSNPGNFLRKKEDTKRWKTIPMNWNFRSRGGILDFVNFLFRGLFFKEVGGIVYNADEAFVPKRASDGASPYPADYAETLPRARAESLPVPEQKDPEPHTEFLLIPAPASRSREADDPSSAEGEARLCAKLICDAVAEKAQIFDKDLGASGEVRDLRYSDVYILLRAATAVPTFEKVFREAGIPLLAVDGGTFLETPEVGGILAFLQTVNDPWDELSLFVTLTGSVFSFTPDEVAQLKIPNNRRPLWDGVLDAAETDPRWKNVVDTIEKYRILAENVSVARLVWTVYTATDFLALESCADPNARRNLMKFYSFARSYTRADGLFGFLEAAERARKSGAVKLNDGASAGDFVRIMTIHKSKGLEAPWCIVPEMGRQFNHDRSAFSFDAEFGVAMRVRNAENTASYNTLLQELIKLRKNRTETAENLRVLYVALTRARDRLTVIGTCPMEMEEKLRAHALHSEKGAVRLSTLLHQSSYEKILLDRTVLHPEARALHTDYTAVETVKTEDLRVAFVGIPEFSCGETEDSAPAAPDTTQKDFPSCGLSAEELKERFSFVYDGHLTSVPAKVSVTEIAKSPQPENSVPLVRETPVTRPKFLDESALSAAEKGTALHTYCQFADFSLPVAEEKARLLAEGHLTEAAVNVMEDSLLQAFLDSDLMKKIRASLEYRREVRFVCPVPVSYYSGNPGDEGEMLMQGSIDLLYETEEGYVIVDFKSDRVTEEKALTDRYSRQLNLYAAAVRSLYDKPVLGCVIWSFVLKKEIPVKEENL